MVLERTSTATFVDVLDRVLDKGIVIDSWMRVALAGLNLLELEGRAGQHVVDRLVARDAAFSDWIEEGLRTRSRRRHFVVDLERRRFRRQQLVLDDPGVLAVQRAEQLTVTDFDLDRRAGALAPPHLLEGNPLSMRRGAMLITRDGQDAIDATYVGFHGRGVHPHVCKLRTAHVDVDLARDLIRIGAASLDAHHAVASPVRPYEEHVARALESEGFRPVAGAMLFVKELAVRIEERALAPAVVR